MQTGGTGQQLKWMAVVSLGVIRLQTYAIPKQGRRRTNNENSHTRTYAKEVTHSKIVDYHKGVGNKTFMRRTEIFFVFVFCVYHKHWP